LCLIRAVLFEQNDQWQTSSHHMMVAACPSSNDLEHAA